MKYFGIIALLVVVAVGAWWGGKNAGSLATDEGQSNTYQDAISQAKEVADKVGATSASPEIATEAPTPTKTVDPGTGKSITVYDGISVSEGTTVLNLSSKGLSGSLKAEVRFLSNLRELNLSGNNFTGLPAEVGQLSKLEVLNLSNNPFTGLPYELGNLKNLKTLDLRGTNYAKADLDVIKKSLPATTKVLVD